MLARLLVEPLYREDGALWETLRAERETVAHYFRQLGQELVIDEGEGYAFLRQIEPEGGERVPRVGRRQPLGYTATLLLVCLREELARFDAAPGDSTRLVLTRPQIRELAGQFLRESNNQVRDIRALDTALRRIEELGFVRAFGAAESDTFEVMRILKARFGPAELEDVKQKLIRHAAERGA
ncbi:DUF4194 domain-containing protein [Congregicoccus parvus]|uniref:DUF4194 domain-containing protein n=1 Tax=Congregicoccus parvus TaxID=3081749 RepID=UPI003FA57144